MKKLITKILFAAIVFSAVGPNIVQAEIGAKQAEKSTWKSMTACLQGTGAIGTEIASRAFNRLDWLGRSAFAGGNKLVSACMNGLKNHSQVVKVIDSRSIIGLAGLAVAGGIIYYYMTSNNNYEDLYIAVLRQCDVTDDEDKARTIFENNSVKKYIPKWYSLRSRIKFMDGFVKYCDGKSNKVRSSASRYRDYLKKPWVTPKILKYIALGAAIGIGLTFKPTVKESPERLLAQLKSSMKNCY